MVVTTGILPLDRSAAKRPGTLAPRAITASAVASASMVVPRSARVAVVLTSPLMTTSALTALSLMVAMMSSRLIPVTSTPATVVPGTAMSS